MQRPCGRTTHSGPQPLHPQNRIASICTIIATILNQSMCPHLPYSCEFTCMNTSLHVREYDVSSETRPADNNTASSESTPEKPGLRTTFPYPFLFTSFQHSHCQEYRGARMTSLSFAPLSISFPVTFWKKILCSRTTPAAPEQNRQYLNDHGHHVEPIHLFSPPSID